MSWIIAAIVGGLIGWIAYNVVRTRTSFFWTIVVGIVGGLLANAASFFGFSGVPATTLSVLGIVSGVLGAVITLIIVNGVAIAGEQGKHAMGPSYHQEISEREREREREREEERRRR